MHKMRYEIGPTSCRICLQPDKKIRSIYKPHDEGDETPNDMLVQLLGVSFSKLNHKSVVPEIICKECEVALNMAFQFRERALKIQNIIEEYCKEDGLLDMEENTSIEDMFIKEENASLPDDEEVEEEDDDDSRHHLEDIRYGNLTQAPPMDDEMHDVVEEIEGQELLEDHEFEQQQIQQARLEHHDLDVELDSNDNEGEIITDDIEYLDENYIEVDPTQTHYDTESAEDLTVDDSLPKFNRSSLRPRKIAQIHRSRKEKENGFICDICGNIYEKRGRMLEHRRRHDAIYHYQCELCSARFQAREQLRKHMYSHTGSKPFKCSFCSRTFFYESVLKTHENVHRGVKPYICRVCNKAFAYSHSLSKHELIHNDIKLFHCDYCNKDFRLPHHMRQHEETKVHQNAVQLAEQMKYEHDDDQLLD